MEMIPGADEYVVEVDNGRTFNAVKYRYSLDAAAELPASVPAGAGAGKL